MKVRDIMTTPVVSTAASTSVPDVAALLRQHSISAVPITDDDGAVVGVVSEYDLIARSGSTARDIMSPGVISANEDTDVEDVRALLVDRRIRRVPVFAGTALVGIVSRTDLVKLMAMEWVCQVCGEPVHGGQPPAQCPRCGAASDRFVQQQTPPGD